MALKFSDKQLIAMAEKWGKEDGENSSDEIEGLDDDELDDIGDEAWNFSGWMNFENHPDLEDSLDELAPKSSKLRLSSKYIAAFVKAIKGSQ